MSDGSPITDEPGTQLTPVAAAPAKLPVFALLATVWLALGAIEVALLVALEHSAVHDAKLTLLERFALAGFDLTVLAGVVAVIGLPLAVVMKLADRLPWLRRFVGGMMFPAAFIVLMLYGADWSAFWSVRSFMTREAMSFWLDQPVQMLHWANPWVLYGVPVVVLAACGVLVAGLPAWVKSWGRRTQWTVVVVAWTLAGGCVAVWATGEVVVHNTNTAINNGVNDTLETRKERFLEDRRSGAGAFAHLALYALHNWTDSLDLLRPDPDVKVTARLLLPMSEYLGAVNPAAVKRYNVILVMVESLRWDELRAYGGTRDVMPTVDAIARESQVFPRAYANATHSNYADVCPVSSHYPLRGRRTHVYPVNPPYPRVLVWDVLKAAGWRTGYFSSSNEYWGNLINYFDTGHIDRLMHAATFTGPHYTSETDTGFAEWVAATKHAGSIDDRYTVDEAMKWVDEKPAGGEPFFFLLNMQSSHFPYVVPKEFKRPFGPKLIDFQMGFNNYPRDRTDVMKDRFADSLNYIDQQLARLVAHLKQIGQWDNTVFVLSGDNGQAFWEHGFACHANELYEEGVRVPLIVRVPGMAPRVWEDRPAQHIDIPPTINHAVGLPMHPGWQGLDLLAQSFPDKRSIYLVVQTPLANQVAIVRGNYKLIHDLHREQLKLFDLFTDPGERLDLTDFVARKKPELMKDLRGRLDSWRYYQNQYYENPAMEATQYPPVVED